MGTPSLEGNFTLCFWSRRKPDAPGEMILFALRDSDGGYGGVACPSFALGSHTCRACDGAASCFKLGWTAESKFYWHIHGASSLSMDSLADSSSWTHRLESALVARVPVSSHARQVCHIFWFGHSLDSYCVDDGKRHEPAN